MLTERTLEKIVTLLLTIGVLAGAWQTFDTAKRERQRPPAHWSNPDFNEVKRLIGNKKEAVFLTDDVASANGRIHTCQFAIIPTKLIVKHDWNSLFVEIDSGKWCIFDAKQSASIEDAKQKIQTWSNENKRELMFHRINPKLAVFRSTPAKEELK